MPKSRHFKTEKGYDNWLAYGHIHDVFKGGNTEIFIGGKKHKVRHTY